MASSVEECVQDLPDLVPESLPDLEDTHDTDDYEFRFPEGMTELIGEQKLRSYH